MWSPWLGCAGVAKAIRFLARGPTACATAYRAVELRNELKLSAPAKLESDQVTCLERGERLAPASLMPQTRRGTSTTRTS